MSDNLRMLEKTLYRRVKEASERERLLEPDDRILVALSGGKDSYTMLDQLRRLVPRLAFKMELCPVPLGQQ